ncbi:hypothetical protein L917_00507, partial [Phytophthora nicotianae]
AYDYSSEIEFGGLTIHIDLILCVKFQTENLQTHSPLGAFNGAFYDTHANSRMSCNPLVGATSNHGRWGEVHAWEA